MMGCDLEQLIIKAKLSYCAIQGNLCCFKRCLVGKKKIVAKNCRNFGIRSNKIYVVFDEGFTDSNKKTVKYVNVGFCDVSNLKTTPILSTSVCES